MNIYIQIDIYYTYIYIYIHDAIQMMQSRVDDAIHVDDEIQC